MKGNGKMSKNYTVMELEAIKHLCKCVNSVASLPADLIADTNVATNTTYSSYKIDAEMSALENDIQRYVDTALAGLNKLTKEVIDDKALVVKENVLYLYKDPTSADNNYMQMMLINGVAVELGSTTCDFSSVYSKDEVDDKFALKIDLDTLTTSFNDLVTSVEKKIDKDKIVTVLDDTVTDDEVPSARLVYEELDKKIEGDNVVKKTDIVTAIDNSSTNAQVPTARAVNELNLRGTQINQSVIDKYGTEIIKYPFGRWHIDGNEIAGKFSDIPWATACIIDITSPIISTRNPWDNTWAYRNYRVQTIENKGTFIRQLESRGTAGVLLDTGWQKVCTTSVADVGITYINTFKNETYVKPASTNVCSYYVSNGNCTISIESICLSTSTDFTQILNGLPKPKTTLYANAIDRTTSANSGARGLFQLTHNGTLSITCNYGDTSVKTIRYLYVSFSYPVAE